MKQRLGKFGSTLAFEFSLKTNRGAVIEGIRKYLADIQPGDIPGMVRKSRFPPLENLDFSVLTDNPEQLERITTDRLIDFIAEARPDLITAIQDMGNQGGKYILKLHRHLLDLVNHPEKELAKSTDYEAKEKMKLATCDNCGKSFTIPEAEASSIKECPFCHAGKDEGTIDNPPQAVT